MIDYRPPGRTITGLIECQHCHHDHNAPGHCASCGTTIDGEHWPYCVACAQWWRRLDTFEIHYRWCTCLRCINIGSAA